MFFLGIISILVSVISFIKLVSIFWEAISDKDPYVSLVPSTKLIQEIIWFTNDILYEKNIKHFPEFTVSYHKHKKYNGVLKNSRIVIYINNHNTTRDIVNSVCHEVGHFIQLKTQRDDFYLYDNYTKKFGYWNNPLERASRKFASSLEDDCLKHLLTKKIIKQVS